MKENNSKVLNKEAENKSKDKYLLDDDLLDLVSGGSTQGKNTGGGNPIFSPKGK